MQAVWWGQLWRSARRHRRGQVHVVVGAFAPCSVVAEQLQVRAAGSAAAPDVY